MEHPPFCRWFYFRDWSTLHHERCFVFTYWPPQLGIGNFGMSNQEAPRAKQMSWGRPTEQRQDALLIIQGGALWALGALPRCKKPWPKWCHQLVFHVWVTWFTWNRWWFVSLFEMLWIASSCLGRIPGSPIIWSCPWWNSSESVWVFRWVAQLLMSVALFVHGFRRRHF